MISVEGNPNIKRCEYGHYYEVKKHAECPYCKDDYKKRNDTIVINNISDSTNDADGRTEILFLDK